MLGKELDDAAAKRRFHDVRDERLGAQLGDIHAALPGQPMARGDDEGQLVAENFHRGQGLLLGNERRHAQIEPVVQQLRRNIARKRPADRQMNVGIELAVTGQRGQQRVNRAFVDAKGKLAVPAGAQIRHGAGDFLAEIEHALGVGGQELPGVGKLAGAGAAREQRFADGLFELADGDAHRGLGAEQLLGGAGKAALAGHGEEYVEFGKVHRSFSRAILV